MLEELLNKLPAYIHDDDEDNRLYLMITRDIKGEWNMCYETEGRCYYATTNPSLTDCAESLLEQLT